jgi:hypothetical protein
MRPSVARARLDERLSAPELARFASPMTWKEIMATPPGTPSIFCRTPKRWRDAVEEAETRGLLTFCHRTKRWHLTDAGRRWVADVA